MLHDVRVMDRLILWVSLMNVQNLSYRLLDEVAWVQNLQPNVLPFIQTLKQAIIPCFFLFEIEINFARKILQNTTESRNF